MSELVEVSDYLGIDYCALGPNNEEEIVHRRKPKISSSSPQNFFFVCFKYFCLG